jgi:hypothetical protein
MDTCNIVGFKLLEEVCFHPAMEETNIPFFPPPSPGKHGWYPNFHRIIRTCVMWTVGLDIHNSTTDSSGLKVLLGLYSEPLNLL